MIAKEKTKIIVLIIFFLGASFRLYNLNYEDLWIDEIISFWIAEPSISFFETLTRHNELEQVPILFNLILKYYYKIFGYNVHTGRYLVCFFGILTIFFSYLLSLEFKNRNSAVFFITLISLNIFLIKYSQELRVYSLMTLLIILALLFLFRSLNKKSNNLDYVLFIIFLLLAIFSHPFSMIILISVICFSMMRLIFYREYLKKLNISIFFISIFSIIYYFSYFINLNELTPWIPQIEKKFFTNFFFSKFFGSRILGILHLVTLIFFISRFRKNLISSKKFQVLVLIIFFSYLLPLIFSIIFKPILIERYIVYIIVPILLIISTSIYNLNKIFLRNALVAIFILLTFANFTTEDTFKQIFKKINKQKPDFHSALSKIEESNQSYFIITKTVPKDEEKIKFYSLLDIAINKYIERYTSNNDFNSNLLKQDKIDLLKIREIWIICYLDLDISGCAIPYNKDEYLVKQNINFSRINLKKIYFRNKT